MSSHATYPPLINLQPTKKTMHAYAQGVGVIPRAHAEPHPKWWHISLKVKPDGLVTDTMKLPDGGTSYLRMDLRQHEVVLSTSTGHEQAFSMRAGQTATEFGTQIIEAVASLGLTADYAREKFENDDPVEYNPEVAERFFEALLITDRVFRRHRETLAGEKGPVQLWPHGFDLAFEWFGTRVETYEEHGEIQEYPAQLNLGFSPGEPTHPDPYFYSNPWPFEADTLTSMALPDGARWHTESWQGSIMEYAELVGDPNAEERLFGYARRVFEVASPTLTA